MPRVIRCGIVALAWAVLLAPAFADASDDLERGVARFQAGQFSVATAV